MSRTPDDGLLPDSSSDAINEPAGAGMTPHRQGLEAMRSAPDCVSLGLSCSVFQFVEQPSCTGSISPSHLSLITPLPTATPFPFLPPPPPSLPSCPSPFATSSPSWPERVCHVLTAVRVPSAAAAAADPRGHVPRAGSGLSAADGEAGGGVSVGRGASRRGGAADRGWPCTAAGGGCIDPLSAPVGSLQSPVWSRGGGARRPAATPGRRAAWRTPPRRQQPPTAQVSPPPPTRSSHFPY